MNSLIKCFDWIFEHIIIYIPLIILCALSAGYVYLLIRAPLSIERLQFLLTIDAATATLAGLSFYASYTSRDEDRKSVYFRCAEKFFHGATLLFVATFLRGCVLLIDDFSWYPYWRVPIQIFLVTTTIFFFLYGLSHLIRGLKDLLFFIHHIRKH